jgi:hypothetical protein
MDLRPGFPSVVDEVTVRLVAAVVLIVGIVALVSGAWWLYAVLAVDFVLRSVFGPRLSPIAQLVLRTIRPRVSGCAVVPRRSAPKRFAASIGAVLTSLATMFAILHAATGSAGCRDRGVRHRRDHGRLPGPGAAAGMCVGCLVFAQLIRLGLGPRADLPGVRRHHEPDGVGEPVNLPLEPPESPDPSQPARPDPC